MIKVIIADDHAILRQGLKDIINRTTNITVVAEAGEWKELYEVLSKNDCDIIILDISMPGRSGLSILKELKEIKPKVQILILSMYEDGEYVIEALRKGADGYITKSSTTENLIIAINKIASGSKYLPVDLAEKILFEGMTEGSGDLHAVLSARELEVMKMIADGKSPMQIGEELCLSSKTINSHRSHILKKMKLESNADLIKYVIKHKIV